MDTKMGQSVLDWWNKETKGHKISKIKDFKVFCYQSCTKLDPTQS